MRLLLWPIRYRLSVFKSCSKDKALALAHQHTRLAACLSAILRRARGPICQRGRAQAGEAGRSRRTVLDSLAFGLGNADGEPSAKRAGLLAAPARTRSSTLELFAFAGHAGRLRTAR